MPQVEIQVRAGRSPASLRRLISAVTSAVSLCLNAPPETVRVIVNEVPLTHWANGDVTLAEKAEASEVSHS